MAETAPTLAFKKGSDKGAVIVSTKKITALKNGSRNVNAENYTINQNEVELKAEYLNGLKAGIKKIILVHDDETECEQFIEIVE